MVTNEMTIYGAGSRRTRVRCWPVAASSTRKPTSLSPHRHREPGTGLSSVVNDSW